ncbi:MAG TPA: hypothetical protein VD884_11205 [Ohtaekwangia sp.]|nr:hypothetical protein [Ohtaekwangia sp.]
MKSKINFIALLLLGFTIMSSCADDDDNVTDDGNTRPLDGKLIYSFTGTVYQLDLKTNVQSVYFTYNTYGFNNWDMSWDEQYRLTSEREAGVFDAAKITVAKNSDGSIVKEFDYYSPNGTDTEVGALLSPDNTKVVYQPTFDNGIVITDLEGNVLQHLEAVNVESESIAFGISDEVLWLPDNSILFTLAERYIFKSPPPYTTLSLVKDMPNTEWANLRVNKQGTQIAMRMNHHIHVMDLDDGKLAQVTESNGAELHADFSPDGKYLVVAKKYGDHLYYWNLAIIPNDGQPYNMDDREKLIIIQPKEETIYSAVDGGTFWIE